MAIREEKEINGIQIGKKGIKLSLLQMTLIPYIENSKDATMKLQELISELAKVEGYKINTQKFLTFQYTNNNTNTVY